jgi:hypothetical protein
LIQASYVSLVTEAADETTMQSRRVLYKDDALHNYDQRWGCEPFAEHGVPKTTQSSRQVVAERQMMEVVVEAQGSPFVFLIVVFGMTTYERLVHALPRHFFVVKDERLAILPSQANKRWARTPSPRRPRSQSPSSSCVLSLIVRFLE